MNKILAWHFLREDCKMRFKPDVKVKPGVEYKAKLPLVMCKNGLHASEQIIDALFYAPGTVVCRVELSGRMIKNNDKICAEKRKVLWMYDAANVLHEFACIVMERALLKERESGREPDQRSWQVIEVKRRWLRGESSSEDLAAAWEAAWAAVWEVAWEVSWETEWEAIWKAALTAAKGATEVATRAATQTVAQTVAQEEYNLLLEQMIICESAKRSLWKTEK